MNLVFIGSSHLDLRVLELTCALPDVCVVGGVTAPPVFSISYCPPDVTNILRADIDDFVKNQSIPVSILQQGMKDLSLLETVKYWQPEAFLVAGWVPHDAQKLA